MPIFRRFASYYKPYKGLFFFDLFCALLVSIVDISFPQILNYFSKNIFTQVPETYLGRLPLLGLVLVIIYLVKVLCLYFMNSWGHIMGVKMEADMRNDLFDHLQKLSFSYYDQNNTGEMMSKVVTDLFDVTELAHHGPENLVICTLKILGSFVLLANINLKLALILLGITIFMAVSSFFFRKKMRDSFSKNRKTIAKVNAQVQDSLSGIRVVKSFANEPLEKEKFVKSNSFFVTAKKASYKVMGLFHSTNSFFQGMLYVSLLVVGGYFIANKQINAVDLATFALYIGIFINPIDVLLNSTELFQNGISGFRRFAEILETVPDVKEKKNAKVLDHVDGNIVYENVSFKYDDSSSVLDNVNINIPAGKTVAFVGPSGGGKTTICSLLPRFYDVSEGAIKIDGKDIRDLTLKSLREAIGIVQQDVYLFAGSLKENIAYGKPDATDEEIMEAAKKANIHDFIMSLEDGYDTYAGERGTKLSGGQKQRISIARVFLKNPKILILDEATSALDNESERYIQSSLEKLSEGRTTIVIAHRLSTIRNADEIIVINEQGIQERGTHEELLKTNGVYANYYNMQFHSSEKNIG